MLRGAGRCDEFTLRDGREVASGTHHVMGAGDIEAESPAVGDWHRLSHCGGAVVAASIHVHGGNIGALCRRRLDAHGAMLDFGSGYDNTVVPSLWDRSATVRSQALW